MHTVNNLVQKPKNIKCIPYSALKQIFNIINIMCEDFTTIPEYYAKYSLFNLKGSKSKVSEMELKLKSAILISFVMLNEEKKRHFVIMNA